MEEGHFVCSTKECNLRFSTEDTLRLHKKRHEMVLTLSKSNAPSSDETPTPTRFIRQCEEIGLFQDLQNVNPFEETFRKAAEDVKKGSAAKQQSISILSRTPSDDLHTPHIFPDEINIEHSIQGVEQYDVVCTSEYWMNYDQLQVCVPTGYKLATGFCRSLSKHGGVSIYVNGGTKCAADKILEEEVVIRTEADTSLKANTTLSHLSPPVSNDRVSTTVSVTEPIVRDRGCILDSITVDNNVRVSAVPRYTPALISDNTFADSSDPVQVLLRMPNGSLVQLATKPVTTPVVPINVTQSSVHLEESVKILPRTCTNGGTVILATQDFQRAAETTPPIHHLTTTDVKQKLKQLLGATSKVTKQANIVQRPAAAVNKIVSNIPAKKVPKNNGDNNLDETEKEKRRKILERNRKAAIRCRERRKRWLEELRKRADLMAVTNRALNEEIRSLKAEVANLRTLLLAHANCPVTLAQTSAHESRVCLASERSEVGNKRPRREGLTLDIEQAKRAAPPTIELDTPTPTIVRSDKVLSSVAPPATPEQDRLVTFTDILANERTSDISDEIVEERHLTTSASGVGGTTTVIQVNPNAVRSSHGFS